MQLLASASHMWKAGIVTNNLLLCSVKEKKWLHGTYGSDRYQKKIFTVTSDYFFSRKAALQMSSPIIHSCNSYINKIILVIHKIILQPNTKRCYKSERCYGDCVWLLSFQEWQTRSLVKLQEAQDFLSCNLSFIENTVKFVCVIFTIATISVKQTWK